MLKLLGSAGNSRTQARFSNACERIDNIAGKRPAGDPIRYADEHDCLAEAVVKDSFLDQEA